MTDEREEALRLWKQAHTEAGGITRPVGFSSEYQRNVVAALVRLARAQPQVDKSAELQATPVDRSVYLQGAQPQGEPDFIVYEMLAKDALGSGRWFSLNPIDQKGKCVRAINVYASPPARAAPEGWRQLVEDLVPDGAEQCCDECGGDDKECPTGCPIRRARSMLSAAPKPGGK